MATAERLPHTPLEVESPHNGISDSLWEIAKEIGVRVPKESTEEQVADAVLKQIAELTEPNLIAYKRALLPLVRKTLQICGRSPGELTPYERIELDMEASFHGLNTNRVDFKASKL